MESSSNDFLDGRFSTEAYLSKLLLDESGECRRIRDMHERLSASHTELLADELLESREKVSESLLLLKKLSAACQRTRKELPEMFLPILEQEKKSGHAEERKLFREEMKKIQGGKQFAAPGRYLKYKERVHVKIDRVESKGYIYVTNDLLIIAVEKKDRLEVYNGLSIRELTFSLEEDLLMLSLPPVTVEVVEGEHNSFSRLFSALEKVYKKKASIHIEEAVINKEEIERVRYNKYLLQIGRVSQISDPSEEEVLEEIEYSYKIEKSWSKAEDSLLLAKKKNILKAFSLYERISQDEMQKQITKLVDQRSPQTKVVESLSKLLTSHMKQTDSLFGEPSIRGRVSLYYESLHIKASETFLKSALYSLSEEQIKEDLSLLQKAFTYNGYSYGYTVELAQSIRKDLLKKRYSFNKKIILSLFEDLIEVENIHKKEHTQNSPSDHEASAEERGKEKGKSEEKAADKSADKEKTEDKKKTGDTEKSEGKGKATDKDKGKKDSKDKKKADGKSTDKKK